MSNINCFKRSTKRWNKDHACAKNRYYDQFSQQRVD